MCYSANDKLIERVIFLKDFKENCKMIARIVLIMFWALGALFTLVTAQKEPKILAVTGIIVGVGMLATKERRRFWAILEWLSFVAYLIILGCIVVQNSYSLALLIGVTMGIMLVVVKRMKNFSEEETD